MSLFSSWFYKEKEVPKTTEEQNPQKVKVGTLLKVYKDGDMLLMGAVSSFTPQSLVITRQPGQPVLRLASKGDEVYTTPADDYTDTVYMMQGTVTASTKDTLRIVGLEIHEYKNRRTCDRQMMNAPVLFYDAGDVERKSPEGVGTLLNIGTGGICVQSRIRRENGNTAQFNIRFPDRQEDLSLQGQIVHTETRDGDWYRYGVRFDQLKPQSSLQLSKLLSGTKITLTTPREHCLTAREVLSTLIENIKRDREANPDSGKEIEKFAKQLEEIIKARYPKGRVWENRAQDDDEPRPCLYISSDHMKAYVCVLPPVLGKKPIDREWILAELRMRGVLGYIPPDALTGIEYLHITLLMQGIPAEDGVDGEITELFPRRPRFVLESHLKRTPDFSEDAMPQAVRRGTVICRLRWPVQGKDGIDVTGKTLVCRQAFCPEFPMGENTAVSMSGNMLVAGVDGLLYIDHDKFCIQPQQVVVGGLHSRNKKLMPDGVLRAGGSLFIDGDVSGGVWVEAEGSIVVRGQFRDGRLISKGGSIRVQGGIFGLEGQTFLQVSGELQAKVIQNAVVEAGDDVVANTISNSNLCCGDTVRVLEGEGIIAGSVIQAKRQILCRRIDGAARKCEFRLGCDPSTASKMLNTQKEIAQAKETQDLLWKNISRMHMSYSKLSDGQKAVLSQLEEQRELYKEKLKELVEYRKQLQDELNIDTTVRVLCEEMEPVLEIQIGDQKDRFTRRERQRCNIHIQNGWIAMETTKKRTR